MARCQPTALEATARPAACAAAICSACQVHRAVTLCRALTRRASAAWGRPWQLPAAAAQLWPSSAWVGCSEGSGVLLLRACLRPACHGATGIGGPLPAVRAQPPGPCMPCKLRYPTTCRPLFAHSASTLEACQISLGSSPPTPPSSLAAGPPRPPLSSPSSPLGPLLPPSPAAAPPPPPPPLPNGRLLTSWVFGGGNGVACPTFSGTEFVEGGPAYSEWGGQAGAGLHLGTSGCLAACLANVCVCVLHLFVFCERTAGWLGESLPNAPSGCLRTRRRHSFRPSVGGRSEGALPAPLPSPLPPPALPLLRAAARRSRPPFC